MSCHGPTGKATILVSGYPPFVAKQIIGHCKVWPPRMAKIVEAAYRERMAKWTIILKGAKRGDESGD